MLRVQCGSNLKHLGPPSKTRRAGGPLNPRADGKRKKRARTSTALHTPRDGEVSGTAAPVETLAPAPLLVAAASTSTAGAKVSTGEGIPDTSSGVRAPEVALPVRGLRRSSCTRASSEACRVLLHARGEAGSRGDGRARCPVCIDGGVAYSAPLSSDRERGEGREGDPSSLFSCAVPFVCAAHVSLSPVFSHRSTLACKWTAAPLGRPRASTSAARPWQRDGGQ